MNPDGSLDGTKDDSSNSCEYFDSVCWPSGLTLTEKTEKNYQVTGT